MRKHSENSSNKLMSSSKDSLSKRQSLFSSFKEISLKEGITPDNANSHEIDNSSEVAVTSFRDSACTFKLTRLIDSRVKPCISNECLMGREFSDIAYFSKESRSSGITYTVNGSNDFQFFNRYRLTELRKHLIEFIKMFHQLKKQGDLLWQDKLLREAIRGNGCFSSLDNLISTDRDLSAPAQALKSLCNSFDIRGSYKSGRGELFKEQEHGFCKDIAERLQFREGSLENSFNFIFSGGNKITDGFSFSGKVSKVFSILRDRELANGIPVNEKEFSYSKGVFFIGFSFSQREFSEIGDKKWVNNEDINTFVREEGKEIDMVATSGFHSSHNTGEVFTVRRNSIHKLGETVLIHRSRKRETDIANAVKTCGRERIFGDINTYKEFKHTSTSKERVLDKAGDASRPILQGDEGSQTQSTYDGFGRQGTDSSKGSITQEIWSSPAFPTLTGKTSMYKFYNKNS